MFLIKLHNTDLRCTNPRTKWQIWEGKPFYHYSFMTPKFSAWRTVLRVSDCPPPNVFLKYDLEFCLRGTYSVSRLPLSAPKLNTIPFTLNEMFSSKISLKTLYRSRMAERGDVHNIYIYI